MGLSKNEIIDILKLRQQYKFSSLLMLGKQDIGNTAELDEYRSLLNKYGISYNEDKYNKLYPDIDEGLNIIIDSVDFFKCFFTEVNALDINAYEGADIIFDLSSNSMPSKLNERWDIVIDGGTLEHIFNQTVAFDNMNHLVKRNGYIYHNVPAAGWVDHGFYSFSPTYFIDGYNQTPDFEIEDNYFIYRTSGKYGRTDILRSQDCRLFKDDSEMNSFINSLNVNEDEFDDGRFNLAVLARKIEYDKANIVVDTNSPTQTMYQEIYQESDEFTEFDDALKKNKDKKIYLYAASTYCYNLIDRLKAVNKENIIAGIIDSDNNKVGKKFNGYKIKSVDDDSIDINNVFYITSKKYKNDIARLLVHKGIAPDNIL